MANKLILYYDDASPPVRSCMLLIKMLNIDVEYKYVDLFKGGQFDFNFLKLNPSHTVPVLLDGNLILTDSHVILIYLSEKYGNSYNGYELYPTNNNKRYEVLNMLFFECSIVFRRDSDFLSEIVRKGYDKIDIEYHKRKILEVYNIMETFLENQNQIMNDVKVGENNNCIYFVGENLTLADICLLTTCSTVNMLIPIENEECKWPLLNKWFKHMINIPEYEINRKGLAKLRDAMGKIGKFPFSTTI